MEYTLYINYNDTGATVAASRFTTSGSGVPELHAMITLPEGTSASTADQLDTIARAARGLASALAPEGLRPVMGRWLLSDAANMAPSLPSVASNRMALSVIEQPPLNSTKAALWLYFMPAVVVEAAEGDLTIAARPSYTHILMASAALPGMGSHTATAALLKDYDIRLGNLGSSLADGCVRTWFFVRDVDHFYRGVVSGRNEVFESVGLTPATHFIASTGIEGRPERPDVTVKMDAWAVVGLRPGQISYIQAPDHLNPTYEYGVAFERATAIDYADRRHLLVSGTASIDSEGKIVSPGDIDGQTLRMLENVEALLGRAGMGWDNVAHMIIYLRDIADHRAVERIFAERFPAASSAPRVVVRAPVCRPGWLIEMECMAIAPATNPDYAPF